MILLALLIPVALLLLIFAMQALEDLLFPPPPEPPDPEPPGQPPEDYVPEWSGSA